MNFSNMTSAHFIFIPTVLFVGICIGWVLGSRAARDAYAMAQHKKGSRLSRLRLPTESQRQASASRAEAQSAEAGTQGSGKENTHASGEPPGFDE